VAHDVHARMSYLNDEIARAVGASITQSLAPIGGRGGVIAVSRNGQIALPFNSTGMYRAWVREGDVPRAAIFAA
jgi:L-asparaginase / beta-aspartyl-peptidase